VNYLVTKKYMPRLLKRIKVLFVIYFRKETLVIRKVMVKIKGDLTYLYIIKIVEMNDSNVFHFI
jgi:hypothetical protein